jgi:phospholipid/cholesterol/gamma-HCH transport system ATP-binding protein
MYLLLGNIGKVYVSEVISQIDTSARHPKESPVIALKGVSKFFDHLCVLKNISFAVEQGERISLIGPGGSGKSTILKILLGLLPASGGEVLLFDRPIYKVDGRTREGLMRRVGVAFQQVGLFDFMNVEENLRFALTHKTTKSPEEIAGIIEQMLQGVKLLHAKHLNTYELSGGMQRRVGIARALCTDPQLAIFDEPTSGLDPVTSTIILNMISDLAHGQNEKCLMVATSNVETAIRFADRVVVINEGEVVADGPWRELLVEGPAWVQRFLGLRFIGLDIRYAEELQLPKKFIARHWH